MANSPGQYNPNFNVALQWMWGDGFLSPGGPDEVREMMKGVTLDGCRVLDVGSGLGAIAVMLVEEFGAAEVVGVDVEAHLIESSRERANKAGLANQIVFQLVEPGPLPFPAASFDVVFSKDAIVHMPVKRDFYAEALRVLKPGGRFLGSDWLRGDDSTFTDRAKAWIEYVHLDYKMQDISHTTAAMEGVGFSSVTMNDRNEWYQQAIRAELESLAGDNFVELAKLIGEKEAQYRRQNSQMKQGAIDDGFLRPTHFVAHKPS
tara:strand:- start:422 stop:1204 length:783 start_codon:yes stop_codon:yes gene_type:complete